MGRRALAPAAFGKGNCSMRILIAAAAAALLLGACSGTNGISLALSAKNFSLDAGAGLRGVSLRIKLGQ